MQFEFKHNKKLRNAENTFELILHFQNLCYVVTIIKLVINDSMLKLQYSLLG